MDAPLDLYGGSRAELADRLLAQRDRAADLEWQLADLCSLICLRRLHARF